jgi:hypothetical protein
MRRICNIAALVIMLAAAACIEFSCTSKTPEASKSAPPAQPTESAASACTLPTAMAASNEQTAWQLLVAASCPSNGRLTWETWTEQTCLAQPNSPGCAPAAGLAVAPARHLHASRLAGRLRRPTPKLSAAGTPGGCGAMTTLGNASAALKPFVPKNLSSTAQLCEEALQTPPRLLSSRRPLPAPR